MRDRLIAIVLVGIVSSCGGGSNTATTDDRTTTTVAETTGRESTSTRQTTTTGRAATTTTTEPPAGGTPDGDAGGAAVATTQPPAPSASSTPRGTSPDTSPPAPTVATTTTAAPRLTHTLAGTLLVDERFDKSGRPCGGYGRFSDFQVGQVMSVKDQSGQLLSEGRLETCTWVENQECFNCPGQPNYSTGKPEFTFSVSSVPESSSYIVRVSWKEWTPISHAEMEASNWRIDFGVR